MKNLKKNRKKKQKKKIETCQNHNLCILELPSERVSVDVNTLLSQSN